MEGSNRVKNCPSRANAFSTSWDFLHNASISSSSNHQSLSVAPFGHNTRSLTRKFEAFQLLQLPENWKQKHYTLLKCVTLVPRSVDSRGLWCECLPLRLRKTSLPRLQSAGVSFRSPSAPSASVSRSPVLIKFRCSSPTSLHSAVDRIWTPVAPRGLSAQYKRTAP